LKNTVGKGLLIFLFCSLAIHLLLAMALPDFMGNDSGIIPIQLLGSRGVDLEVLPQPVAGRLREAGRKGVQPDTKVPPVDLLVLEKRMEELSLGENLKAPSADVLFAPVQKAASKEQALQAWPFYKEVAKAFEEARGSGQPYPGPELAVEIGADALKNENVEVDPGEQRVMARLCLTAAKKIPGKGKNGKLGISGPVSRRELTYVPPVPDVKARIETEFEMKFWVRPDGTIDRVIPLNRAGDVELERVAANYLRKWRFRAIPANKPQIEQWGTVTIKFRLQ